MGSILRALFREPEMVLTLLAFLPHIISVVLGIMIAFTFWRKNLSADRVMILVGVIISTLSYITATLVNHVILPRYGVNVYKEYMFFIQANYVIGSIGGMLFSWGLYRYFKQVNDKPETSNDSEYFDPFITRND